jgi:hypothetical protein
METNRRQLVISGVPALPEDLWESMRRAPRQTSTGVNRAGINLRVRIWKNVKREKQIHEETAVLVLGMSILGATSTLAQDVRYDFDKDKDFSKYKTYKWVPIKGADQPDDLTAKQVTAAIDTELASKGLTKTDSTQQTCTSAIRRPSHGETVHVV